MTAMIKPEIQNMMLRRCKFCGSLKRNFCYTHGLIFSNRNKYAECEDCGYKTKKHKTEYEGMVEWNG